MKTCIDFSSADARAHVRRTVDHLLNLPSEYEDTTYGEPSVPQEPDETSYLPSR